MTRRRDYFAGLGFGMASSISAAVVRPPCSLTILLKNTTPCAIDQECRWISRFLCCIPAKSVHICERVARIQKQIEIIRKLLVCQELVCPGPQILRRTGIDQHHMSSCIREALRFLDKILNLTIAIWALIARVSAARAAMRDWCTPEPAVPVKT